MNWTHPALLIFEAFLMMMGLIILNYLKERTAIRKPEDALITSGECVKRETKLMKKWMETCNEKRKQDSLLLEKTLKAFEQSITAQIQAVGKDVRGLNLQFLGINNNLSLGEKRFHAIEIEQQKSRDDRKHIESEINELKGDIARIKQ